jgi:hypothetical protein
MDLPILLSGDESGAAGKALAEIPQGGGRMKKKDKSGQIPSIIFVVLVLVQIAVLIWAIINLININKELDEDIATWEKLNTILSIDRMVYSNTTQTITLLPYGNLTTCPALQAVQNITGTGVECVDSGVCIDGGGNEFPCRDLLTNTTQEVVGNRRRS